MLLQQNKNRKKKKNHKIFFCQATNQNWPNPLGFLVQAFKKKSLQYYAINRDLN